MSHSCQIIAKSAGNPHSYSGLVDVASRDRLPFRVPEQEEVTE